MAYCEECGAQLPEGALFCEECGHSIEVPHERVEMQSTIAQQGDTDQVELPSPTPPASLGRLQQAEGEAGRRRNPIVVPLVIIALALLMSVALLYIVPRFIGHPHDPHEDQSYSPPVSEETTNEDVTNNDGAVTTEGQSSSNANHDTESSQDSNPSSNTTAQKDGAYSTTDTPVIAEFTWFDNDMMNGNAPVGIKRITDLAQVSGGWKAYIYNYATFEEGSLPVEQLLNVYVSGSDSKAVLTFDWYYTRLGDGSTHEDETLDSAYSGSWSEGSLEALGAGSVRLSDFWELDSHQYGIGRITWPDGGDGAIALVRP